MVSDKERIGRKAAEFVKDGMIVGLGTGSTVYWTLKEISIRIKDGLQIKGIPTSLQTEKLAREWGIPLTNFSAHTEVDLAIDGADAIDPSFALIKGGGGALLREKIVAAAAHHFIVVADSSKWTPTFTSSSLPVEVVSFGWESTAAKLSDINGTPKLRKDPQGKPFVTDNGNFILDCTYNEKDWEDLHSLQMRILSIPGVTETGLFIGMANQFITIKNTSLHIVENDSF